MKGASQRSGALCGLAAVAVFGILYSTAVSLDSRYSFGEDYISDLGVGEGAWAFNSGVIASGALMVVFAVYGLGPSLGKAMLSRASVAALSISGLFLACVGIFTEDYDPAHLIVSISFFLSLLVSLGLVTVALYRSGGLGRFGWGASLLAFALGMSLLLGGGTPLVETIAVMAALVWGLLMAAAILVRLRAETAP